MCDASTRPFILCQTIGLNLLSLQNGRASACCVFETWHANRSCIDIEKGPFYTLFCLASLKRTNVIRSITLTAYLAVVQPKSLYTVDLDRVNINMFRVNSFVPKMRGTLEARNSVHFRILSGVTQLRDEKFGNIEAQE